MKAVSVVIPALGDVALLERALGSLFVEFERRSTGDEVVIVDDTGLGSLAQHKDKLFAGRTDARLITRKENGGFAKALETGVEAAGCDLVFSMNSDVVVQLGFLDPLVRALATDDVFAVAPKVLLDGDEERVESFPSARLHAGLLDFRSAPSEVPPSVVTPIPFAVGGTFLFERQRFLELGGFDPLFAPFYFEDVDLCWRAWRHGWRTLYVPDAVVMHHHKGTIGKLLTESRRRAAVERGELCFNWKHLPEADLADHLALLFRRAVDSFLTDERDGLVWLELALERLGEASIGRRELKGKRTSLEVLAELNGRSTSR